MKWSSCAVGLAAMSLVGCGIGRVITEPVRYVFGEPEPASATSTSDVTNPGQPVAVPSPTSTPRVASRKSNRPSNQSASRVASSKPAKTPPAAQKPVSSSQFPVAKPVPGKPGLVYSPFNAGGGYIDVSGYAPGSKVKDPDSQKIFVVP